MPLSINLSLLHRFWLDCGLPTDNYCRCQKANQWQPALIFKQGYKPSKVWRPHAYVELLREFVYRQSQCKDLTIHMLAWMFDRNERTIRRWISDKKHTEK